MTREDIIRMAREAGINIKDNPEKASGVGNSIVSYYDLKRFAALVAAAEREACAKACDDTALLVVKDTEWSRGYVQGILDVADDIRARSNK